MLENIFVKPQFTEPPSAVEKIAGFISNGIPVIKDGYTEIRTKRQFENLINDFVNERFPKEDRRFPGKERNVLVSADASKGLAVIRIVAQYDPYNLDHYSALECKIKTDSKGNSTVKEEKKLLSSFKNAHEFLENGPGEPLEFSPNNQKTTDLDSKLKAFPED